MNKLKYIKIENDATSLSENIPIGIDTENVDVDIAGNLKIYRLMRLPVISIIYLDLYRYNRFPHLLTS